jgi:Adenylate and Guanylate cyclase catalytic domain
LPLSVQRFCFWPVEAHDNEERSFGRGQPVSLLVGTGNFVLEVERKSAVGILFELIIGALGVTRIGAHAGPAIVGNFGGGRFFNYTAYGDTINVAARLETANKRHGTRICVSATLPTKVEEFRGRPVGDLVLRGKTEALRVFEPLRRGDE